MGGLGLTPGGNIGKDTAIFEAVHGRAPDIAGKDEANPGAVILAGVTMLNHLGLPEAAAKIERALTAVLRDGRGVTRDLNPQAGVGTRAMTEAILERL